MQDFFADPLQVLFSRKRWDFRSWNDILDSLECWPEFWLISVGVNLIESTKDEYKLAEYFSVCEEEHRFRPSSRLFLPLYIQSRPIMIRYDAVTNTIPILDFKSVTSYSRNTTYHSHILAVINWSSWKLLRSVRSFVWQTI